MQMQVLPLAMFIYLMHSNTVVEISKIILVHVDSVQFTQPDIDSGNFYFCHIIDKKQFY